MYFCIEIRRTHRGSKVLPNFERDNFLGLILYILHFEEGFICTIDILLDLFLFPFNLILRFTPTYSIFPSTSLFIPLLQLIFIPFISLSLFLISSSLLFKFIYSSLSLNSLCVPFLSVSLFLYFLFLSLPPP